jgi:tryptophanase
MRNKVQVSFCLKKEFLLLMFVIGCQLPATIRAQGQSAENSNTKVIIKSAELKVKQQGSNWQFAFPRIQFRSALKVTNSNGAVVKAVMVDEGMEAINVSLSNLPKGIYQCVLENRTQRFAARVMVR